MLKNKNEGKKNIQIDEDVYLKLRLDATKAGMPVRHYLHWLIKVYKNEIID